ncbi:hypothetical protein IMCC20628_03812 [Hoeflea sp. IMCC20628]|nr:hypothetical protein IMCC20628_03812 [Hoeflea sp. IMCC20628]
MLILRNTRRTGECPFPQARPAQALREEDAFMELHGGAGARLIYLIVDWVASGIGAAGRTFYRMSPWQQQPDVQAQIPRQQADLKRILKMHRPPPRAHHHNIMPP